MNAKKAEIAEVVMVKIFDRLFIGPVDDCRTGTEQLAVVHACKSPCHQQVVGYRGSLSPNHPNFRFSTFDDRDDPIVVTMRQSPFSLQRCPNGTYNGFSIAPCTFGSNSDSKPHSGQQRPPQPSEYRLRTTLSGSFTLALDVQLTVLWRRKKVQNQLSAPSPGPCFQPS